MADWKSTHGPSTYRHAGASKIGWPHDHSVDDTYEVPPYTWVAKDKQDIIDGNLNGINVVKKQLHAEDTEYVAQFGGDGSAILFLVTKRSVAKFDTFADAKTAAEALNNHKGY